MKKSKILLITFLTIALSAIIIRVGNKYFFKEAQNNDFNISETGAWAGKDSGKYHFFDQALAKNLALFFKNNNANSIIDLGAGEGKYSEYFTQQGIFTSCYDGNPDTQTLSNGRCAVINLTEKINLNKHDWVLSLEVGEHLPQKYEDILIDNLNAVNIKGIVLSWAVKGQGGDGHVNEQSNEYIKQKFLDLGYIVDLEAEQELRKDVIASWFKNTIMVFRRPKMPF